MPNALRWQCERLSVSPPILRGKLRRRRHGDEQNRDVGEGGIRKSAFSDASPTLRFGSNDGERLSGLCPPERNYMQLQLFSSRVWSDTLFFPPSVTSVCSLSLTTPVGCGTKQTKFRDRSNGTWPKKESTCVTKRRAADAWRQGARQKSHAMQDLLLVPHTQQAALDV